MSQSYNEILNQSLKISLGSIIIDMERHPQYLWWVTIAIHWIVSSDNATY